MRVEIKAVYAAKSELPLHLALLPDALFQSRALPAILGRALFPVPIHTGDGDDVSYSVHDSRVFGDEEGMREAVTVPTWDAGVRALSGWALLFA